MTAMWGRCALAALLAVLLGGCDGAAEGNGPGTVHAHLNGQAGAVLGGPVR